MVGVFGARGTGKNAWSVPLLRAEKRLLVWDHKHDPTMEKLGAGFTDLGAFIRGVGVADKEGRGAFQLRYMPDLGGDVLAQFELFCRVAFAVGNLCMAVDELPEVTKASGGGPSWRRCVNVGRLYKGQDGRARTLTIYGLGQRPGEVDKAFMNNLDVIHTGRIANGSDARVLADYLAVDYRQLMALPDLHWIERRQGTAEPVCGVLTFAKKPARGVKPSKGGALRGPVLTK